MYSIINRQNYDKSTDLIDVTPELFRSISFPIAAENTAGQASFCLLDYLTADSENIRHRQGIFSDILRIPALNSLIPYITEKLSELSDLSRSIGTQEIDNEHLLYSYRELTVFTEFIDEITEKFASFKNEVTSPGLLLFFSSAEAVRSDPEYSAAKATLEKFTSGMNSITSLTIGVNLDAQLNVKEAGLISVDEHPFVSDSPIDRIFRAKDYGKDYRCLTAIGIKEAGLSLSASSAVNLELYRALNKVMNTLLKKAEAHL